MKPPAFHPEARIELAEAAQYYAAIVPELGQRFYAVIDQLIAEACQTPGTFRFIRKPARRHFAREFPYGIIYVECPTTSGSSPSCLSAENPVTGSAA